MKIHDKVITPSGTGIIKIIEGSSSPHRKIWVELDAGADRQYKYILMPSSPEELLTLNIYNENDCKVIK